MSESSPNIEKLEKLKAPFPYSDVGTMIKNTFEYDGVTKGLVIYYVDSRAIQNRLDEVFGPFHWYNQYVLWQTDAQICGLSLYDEERDQWITKYDGAGNTNYEAVKGGLSEAFKRAAVHWGIGRYLYEIGNLYVEVKAAGKNGTSYYPKKEEYDKIEAHYQKFINQLNGGNAKPTPAVKPSQGNQNQQKSQSISNKPSQQDNPQNNQPAQSQIYYVKSTQVSGNSKCVVLINADTETEGTAYITKEDSITANIYITNVLLEKKAANFGDYFLLKKYDVFDQKQAKAA